MVVVVALMIHYRFKVIFEDQVSDGKTTLCVYCCVRPSCKFQ